MPELDNQGSNLIFLVSLPRSGSTLLQRILGGHSSVHTTAEPWLMLPPLYALRDGDQTAGYDATLARQGLEDFLDQFEDGRAAYLESVRHWGVELYGKALRQSGKSLFLDKTPRYYHILPELHEVFPQAKFVFLLRNPLAVLSSTLRTWFDNEPDKLAETSNYVDLTRGVKCIAEGLQLFGDQATVVRYEDLVSSPQQTIEQLCRSLGIEFEAAMLEYGQFPAPAGRHGDQTSINKHSHAVSDYLDSWKSNLLGPERIDFARDYLQQLGSGCFAGLGYDFDAAEKILFDDLALSPGLPRPDKHEPADIINAEGEQLYAAGDIEGAKCRFEAALAEDPGFVLAHNNLAVLYWQQHDPEQAVIELSEGLSKCPRHRDLTITAGQIFTALGMERDAASLYKAYLSGMPDDQEILLLASGLSVANSTSDPVDGVVLPVVEEAAQPPEQTGRPVATTPITIITSIAPKGLAKQRRAVQSWLDLGFEVLSLNIQKEIDILLPEFPGVSFVRAKRDGSNLAGRPYVYIDDMLGELKRTGHQIVGIVNSDIILRAHSALVGYLNQEAVGSFLYASRIDIEKPEDLQGKVYHRGFDLFFFDRKIIDKIPKSKFMLGIPWWDYWVPFAPLLHGIKVKRIETPLGYHVWHETNYSDAQLIQFAREFGEQCEQAPFIDLYKQCVDGNYGNVRYSVLSEAALDYLARNSERVYMPETVTDALLLRPEGKENPKVTAIVSTYNSEAFIDDCLNNLISQTIADKMEIIVIDAASPQNERSIVEGYQKRCPNIRYHRTPERIGVYAAWNLVVGMAKGDYLITCSTNDRLREDACEIMARTLDEQPEVALVYGNSFLSKVAHETFDAPTICGLYVWPEYSYELLLDRCMVGPHPMWRRSVHSDVGYFDEKLVALADQEFWLRLGESHKLLNIPDFTGLYYVSEDSITGDTDLTQIETDQIHANYGWRYRYAQWYPKRYARDDESYRIEGGPLMQIIIVMQGGDSGALADTLDSVAAQLYTNWKLTVVSELACPDPLFEQQERLQWVQASPSTPLGDELNRIVEASQADWIAAIEAGERLESAFLSDGYAYLEKHKEWKLVYFDDDQADADGNLFEPRFKPDMNLELLRSSAYIGNACLVNRKAMESVGGFGSSDYALLYDLTLRIHDHFGQASIGHVADIRFHRNVVQALPIEELSIEHRRKALQQHLLRCGEQAVIQDAVVSGCFMLEYQPKSLPKVSILIPAIETGEYVVDCLKSVLSKTDYPDYEVRVLTESGHDTSITRQLSAIADEDARVTVVQNRPNKSGALNSFASEAKGEYLLWLNQDTVVLQKEWLVRLVGCCDREAVGVVGARVINRRKTLVSGGVVTGIGSRGVGGRCNEDLHMQSPGYIGRAQLEQEMDAVPSLCMLVSKALHAETGGFDPQLSISLFRDIDFCQHVREKGKRIVWTPRVTVMYLAERTQVDGVASSDKQAEGQAKILRQRWLHTIVQAPAYNRNLNAMRGDYTLETDRVRGWDPEIDHKPRILTYGTGSYGSWQYRVRQPLDVIQGQGVLHVTHTAFVGKKMTSIPSVAEVERLQPTALLMHNTMHDDFIKSMENYKQENNAFIIFGQDDLMTALPPKNPFAKTVYKDVKKRVRKCLSLADRLVVTTEPLAHALSGMVDDIRVVPNYLDESIWGGLQSKRHAGAKPRVGWAGAQQHLGDLELLEEVVRETASEVDWVFFGMCPPFLRPYVKEVHDAVEFQRYPEKLAQLNLDIALAPLEHNRFNESKSNLRLLEYGILGWAVVASDIHPYRNAPVCRVPNQARAWINAIRERINDLDFTWKEGDRLRDWVRAEWFLHQNAEQWLTALDPASSPVPQYRDSTRAAGL